MTRSNVYPTVGEMSNLMSFSEIKKLAHDSLITGVEGTIKSVYPIKHSPPNSTKKWAVQNFVIMDGDGDEMRVGQWTGDEVSRSAEGSKVTISSKSGPKGMVGVYANDNEYKGTTTREIRVGTTGQIVLENDSSDQQGGPTTPSSADPVDAERAFMENLKRGTNALYAITVAVGKLRAILESDGKTMTPEQEQAFISILFINADKSGLIKSLPLA